MKGKFASAVLLSLGLTGITTGHVSAPIAPVDETLFREYDLFVAPKITAAPIFETRPLPSPYAKPDIDLPKPVAVSTYKPTPKIVKVGSMLFDPVVSWYGPGFYGKRTACGLAYTKTILGVAHKTLPCGTLVTFMWKGRRATVPVIDRGPYVAGRQWDLSGGLCVALDHCFTGPIYYDIVNH